MGGVFSKLSSSSSKEEKDEGQQRVPRPPPTPPRPRVGGDGDGLENPQQPPGLPNITDERGPPRSSSGGSSSRTHGVSIIPPPEIPGPVATSPPLPEHPRSTPHPATSGSRVIYGRQVVPPASQRETPISPLTTPDQVPRQSLNDLQRTPGLQMPLPPSPSMNSNLIPEYNNFVHNWLQRNGYGYLTTNHPFHHQSHPLHHQGRTNGSLAHRNNNPFPSTPQELPALPQETLRVNPRSRRASSVDNDRGPPRKELRLENVWCEICGRCFGKLSSLKTHLYVGHPDSEYRAQRDREKEAKLVARVTPVETRSRTRSVSGKEGDSPQGQSDEWDSAPRRASAPTRGDRDRDPRQGQGQQRDQWDSAQRRASATAPTRGDRDQGQGRREQWNPPPRSLFPHHETNGEHNRENIGRLIDQSSVQRRRYKSGIETYGRSRDLDVTPSPVSRPSFHLQRFHPNIPIVSPSNPQVIPGALRGTGGQGQYRQPNETLTSQADYWYERDNSTPNRTRGNVPVPEPPRIVQVRRLYAQSLAPSSPAPRAQQNQYPQSHHIVDSRMVEGNRTHPSHTIDNLLRAQHTNNRSRQTMSTPCPSNTNSRPMEPTSRPVSSQGSSTGGGPIRSILKKTKNYVQFHPQVQCHRERDQETPERVDSDQEEEEVILHQHRCCHPPCSENVQLQQTPGPGRVDRRRTHHPQQPHPNSANGQEAMNLSRDNRVHDPSVSSYPTPPPQLPQQQQQPPENVEVQQALPVEGNPDAGAGSTYPSFEPISSASDSSDSDQPIDVETVDVDDEAEAEIEEVEEVDEDL